MRFDIKKILATPHLREGVVTTKAQTKAGYRKFTRAEKKARRRKERLAALKLVNMSRSLS